MEHSLAHVHRTTPQYECNSLVQLPSTTLSFITSTSTSLVHPSTTPYYYYYYYYSRAQLLSIGTTP
eukprot:6542810-Pyramimonas_sp.AAC.1